MRLTVWTRQRCVACGPWKDRLGDLSRRFEVPLRTVECDENEEEATRNGIRMVPTVHLIDDGEIVGIWTGASPAILARIERDIRDRRPPKDPRFGLPPRL